jgi:uncharacterized protein
MKERRILFRCKTGSHLYGLNHPNSDLDYFTVFMPTTHDLLGLQKCEIIDESTKPSGSHERNSSDDVDDKWYSLPRYLHLLLMNNPNIVETLFATKDVIDVCEPEFQFLLDNYQKIVSQRVFHTFSGYAYSQKAKLVTKKERYTSLKAAIELIESATVEGKDLNFFEDEYRNSRYWRDITEAEASLLNSTLKYYKGSKHNCESFHQGMDLGMIYRHIRKEYEMYGWRVKTDTFLTLGMDIKFAYHLIRLLAEGIELATTGKLSFPISGKAREDILAIRNAQIDYDTLMTMYEDYEKRFKAIHTDTLPHSPDFDWANDWLVDTLKKAIIGEV